LREKSPTVFVVDDDASVRKALARVLKAAGHHVKVFASAHAFQEQYHVGVPGCLVLDVELPDVNGLDLQQQLAADGYHLPIIFVTGHGDIPMSVRAMKAGAVDFLTKPFQPEMLIDAVERALARDTEECKRWDELTAIRARVETLTEREREVDALVVSGLPNKQSAVRLGTAEKTIKVHRGRIMHKMGADSLADLVAQRSPLRSPRRWRRLVPTESSWYWVLAISHLCLGQ
jgi:FixJ family two-component response regulator